MRGMIAAAYFMALGYAVAKTGVDEDLREIMAAGYKRLVSHTMALAEDAQAEKRREIRAAS
jgi:hypothetical protein